MYLCIYPNLSQKCDQLFRVYVAGVSYVSCTICIICCFVVPRFSPQIIHFAAYRSYASYVSCTICIICNKCICVFPQIFPKNVTNYLVSMYHVYHMYHVPYVSYVTNVFVYSHICPGICPKNVTNFCGCVLHASVVATVVRIPRSEVTLHVIGREAGCGWCPRFFWKFGRA